MGSTVHFGLVELDLLATYAGAPVPFPLRVPSYGRFVAERAELLATAGQTLRLRELADDDGPVGIAADLVAALTGRRGAIDLVVTKPGQTVGVLAMLRTARSGSALVCRQRRDDTGAHQVEVRRVGLPELVETLVAQIGDHPAARTMPVRLPVAAVQAARSAMTGDGDERDLADVVAEYGGDAEELEALVMALPSVSAGGQLGATCPDGGRHVRVGAEVSWLDGPYGRYRVSADDGDGWLSVNPLRAADLRVAVAELVDLVRAAPVPRPAPV